MAHVCRVSTHRWSAEAHLACPRRWMTRGVACGTRWAPGGPGTERASPFLAWDGAWRRANPSGARRAGCLVHSGRPRSGTARVFVLIRMPCGLGAERAAAVPIVDVDLC